MLYECQDIIASGLVDLVEPAKVKPCVIQTIGSPYKAPFIWLSNPHLAFMREEVSEMIRYGLVKVGSGPWAAPAFAVYKPCSTKFCVVVNYKDTNAQTICDSTPLPQAKDTVRFVG